MEVMPQQNSLAKAVTLAYAPHPFGMDKQVMPVLAGITIHQACINAGVDGNQPIVVFLNGELVPVADWQTKTLIEGDFLTVQAEVTGGGGDGGSNPLQVVGMIALTYFTMGAGAGIWASGLGLTTATGALTLGGMLAGGAMFMAGSMVINSVFAPSAPSMNFNGGAYEQPSPTYSLTGGSNRMRPYEAMPLIMGTHRFFPDATMRPYTEFRGQDQYLYQSFNAGLIPAALTDFRIGSTPINQFSDVQLTIGGTDNFPKNVDTQSGFLLSSSAGWITRTGSTDCYMMAIDVEAILYYANDKGGIDSNSCQLELEWRSIGGLWQAFTEGYRSTGDTGSTSTIRNNSQKPLRLTYLMKPTSVGQYEVRIRKISVDSTESRSQNTINVSAVRSYQRDDSNYAGQQRITLTIKASDQLNGAVAQLSCLASSKAQVWNGSTWVEQVTSNPAHWFMDFCKGRFINGRLAYGLGLTDNQIDFTSLMAWVGFCNSEGLTFNAIIDGAKTAADVLQMIGRAGFGSPSWSSGKLGVVWDGRMQPPVAVFGMANIIKGSFNVSYLTDQLADEFVVSYTDPNDDYNQAQVRVANVATPINSTNVDLFGCTSKAMAGKFANYLAAQQIYRRRKVTWETDAEGFVCQRGDVVLLSHDLTQWGYSGRVLAISGSTVTLDRSVSSSNGNYLMVRHSDGSMTTHTTSTTGDASVLTVSPSVVDSAPLDCVYTFSPLVTQGKRVKITSIQPINNHRLRIIATDDDAQFYAAWDGTFNAVEKQSFLSDGIPSIANLKAEEYLAYVGGFVVPRVALSMDWSANVESVSIRYRVNGGAWQQSTSYANTTVLLLENSAGKLDISVTPLRGHVFGNEVTMTMSIYGKTALPKNITGFSVINSNGTSIASWDIHDDLDVRINGRFEIRHQPGTNASWENSYWLADAPGSSTNYIVPSITGTYLIRAFDDTGNPSQISSFYLTEASITGFTTLSTISGFAGTAMNTVTDGTTLMLASNIAGVVAFGSFEHSSLMNFGSVKTVQLSIVPDVSAYSTNNLIDNIEDIDSVLSIDGNVPIGMDCIFYMSISQTASGTDWTPWVQFSKCDVRCWRAKFKVELVSSDVNANIKINQLSIYARERA